MFIIIIWIMFRQVQSELAKGMNMVHPGMPGALRARIDAAQRRQVDYYDVHESF